MGLLRPVGAHDQEAISMKGLITAATVLVILMVAAIALVVINADDTATALQTETAQPQTESTQPQTETAEPETDGQMPEFMEERLQDLVERGFITQEQLDEMEGRFGEHGPWNGELPEGFDPEQLRERLREHGPWNGELPEGFDPEQFMGPGFGRHGFGFFGGNEDLMGLLGVAPEEMMDAMAEGTPLSDAIEDPDAFVDSLVGLMEEGLNQAVEEGHLTPAEAEDLLAEARSHAKAFINGEGFEGKGFMGPRGPGGFHDFGHFGPHHGEDADTATAGYSV